MSKYGIHATKSCSQKVPTVNYRTKYDLPEPQAADTFQYGFAVLFLAFVFEEKRAMVLVTVKI